MEYLGYILMSTGIKLQPKKVKVILASTLPQQVKDLRKFLGMIQYYRDIWARCNFMLASLTSLVGECGLAEAAKANKTTNVHGTGIWYTKKHSMT